MVCHFFSPTIKYLFLPTCPLGDSSHFYFLLLKFFVMINRQLSAIVLNISLQLKVWIIFKVLFGVMNKHELIQVHHDIK